MQKIMSLIIFLALIVWTWNITHTSEAVSFETHSGIQMKLAELIKQTLLNKKPNAKKIQIVRLWTEPLSDNKVRAIFAYKFTEGESDNAAEQAIEGEAILHREPSEDPETDKWTLQNVKTTNDSINFTEGILITPHMEEETPTAVPSATPAATPLKN